MGSEGVKAWQAKIFYVGFLGLGTLLGYIFAQVGENANEDGGGSGSIDFLFISIDCFDEGCNGQSAIIRVSLASVLFFTLMLLGTVPVPTAEGEKAWRPLLGEGFHRGFWGGKLIIYFGGVIGMMFWENLNEDAFIGVARFVSMAFLVMQILVLIDFAYIWDETWIDRSDVENDFADGSKCWLISLIGISALLYILAYGGMIAMFVLYSGCGATIGITSGMFIISTAGIILFVFRDKIWDEEDQGGSIAPPAVVAAYLAYLGFSAALSNPNGGDCDPFENNNGESPGEIIVSIIIAVGSLVWVALSVSGHQASLVGGGGVADREPLDLGGAYEIEEGTYAREVNANEGDGDEDDQYSEDKLWFFHFIMITASFYMSMVLTNWGVLADDIANGDASSGNISMFVKAAAGWAAGLLFIWTIVAPHVMPDREW